jgi:hypothetical protein
MADLRVSSTRFYIHESHFADDPALLLTLRVVDLVALCLMVVDDE